MRLNIYYTSPAVDRHLIKVYYGLWNPNPHHGLFKHSLTYYLTKSIKVTVIENAINGRSKLIRPYTFINKLITKQFQFWTGLSRIRWKSMNNFACKSHLEMRHHSHPYLYEGRTSSFFTCTSKCQPRLSLPASGADSQNEKDIFGWRHQI